jgi:serine kinase
VKVAYRATELGFTQKMACKVVTKANASRDFVNKFLPREISIVKRINHPNITRVFHIIDLEDHVFMFMDICEKGDLLDCIRLKGHLSEPRARLYTRSVLSLYFQLYL